MATLSRRKPPIMHSSVGAWLLFIAAVWATVLGFALWKRAGHSIGTNVITSVTDRPEIQADGRACRIQIGRNERRAVRVILIRQHTLPSPLRPDPTQLTSASTTRPSAAPLKSQAVVVAEPPAEDAVRSGLWINGIKHPLKQPLTVVYVSDVNPATEVRIPDDLQAQFISEAENAEDEFAFIAKWITPRLSGSTNSIAPVK